MPRSIPCPACAAKLVLPDRLPDHVKSVSCPQCKKSMSVQRKSPPPEPPAPAKAAIQTAPTVKEVELESDYLPDLDSIGLADDEKAAPSPPKPPTPSRPPDPPPAGEDADVLEHELSDEEPKELETLEDVSELENLEATDADEFEELEQVEDETPEAEILDEEEEDDEEEERPEPLPGLLEYDEFLIKPKASLVNLHYDIQEYDSGDVVGTVSESRGVMGFLAPGLSRKAANLTMHDGLRDKVLCTLYRPMSLLKSSVEIRDRKKDLIGTIKFRFLQQLGGTIFDQDDKEWGTIAGKWGSVFDVKNRNGKSLGKFMLEIWKTKKSASTFMTPGLPWYVKVNKRLRYEYDGKLLMLALVVAYDMARISSKTK